MNPNINFNGYYNGGSSRFLGMQPSPMKPPRFQSKVEGNKRVRLPYDCARSVFQLCDKLGHHNPSQTVEWLFNEAKGSVDAVLGGGNPVPPPPPTLQAFYPTMVPYVPMYAPFPAHQNFNSAPVAFAQPLPTNVGTNAGTVNLSGDMLKYFCGPY